MSRGLGDVYKRQLEARIKYLKTEFSKADKIPPAFPPLPDDLADRNRLLSERVKIMENLLFIKSG